MQAESNFTKVNSITDIAQVPWNIKKAAPSSS